ncbi:MAG: hypothetical protein IPL65_17980 [Lewinellaceae bacterium]|nr:hypothetical protein [Lewinellaceae bacterium]
MLPTALTRKLPTLLCWLYPIGILAITQHDPFFWDSIQLASKHAHFFYEHHLHWEVLPTDIDSGHPPIFGYYLAVLWTLFGKTLPVSHWAMFPFLMGITGLLLQLGSRFLGKKWAPILFIIVMADPVMAGQSMLVSPDIPLLFFFLLAVHSITARQHFWLAVAVLGLVMVSLRGMMVGAALGTWWLFLQWHTLRAQPRMLLWMALSFVPGIAFGLWFLGWHEQSAGWTGFHPESPWAPAFQSADWKGMLRNVAILGWRWLDLGRFAAWALLAWMLLRWRSGQEQAPNAKLAGLFGLTLGLLSVSAVMYQNLSAHRYFLPAMVALHILALSTLISSSLGQTTKKVLIGVYLLAMVSGNCWIYPRGVSMDWDATLAYRPYFDLRAQAVGYLDQYNIPFSTVGTAFPSLNTGENLSLNGDQRNFAPVGYEQNKFILASNIFNDLNQEDYQILESPPWVARQTWKAQGVYLTLYEKQ